MKLLRYIKKIISPQLYCTVTTSEAQKMFFEKTILITGGSSGIGFAIAEKAIDCGANVILIARREDKLNKIKKKLGDNCFIYVFDITDFEKTIGIFKKLENLFSLKINALVNNAGIYINLNCGDYGLNDFDKIMDINLKAPFFLTQDYIRYCKENIIEGNILFTASNRALFGDYGPYGISKCALIHFMKGIAKEVLRNNIRVNAIAPGMTASEINGLDPKGDLYTESAKGRRVLLPNEIAEVACFLLSDYSKCITGAVIPCDEGDSLR